MFYLTCVMYQILTAMVTEDRYWEAGDIAVELDLVPDHPTLNDLRNGELVPLSDEGLIRICNRPGQDTWYVITPKGTKVVQRELSDEYAHEARVRSRMGHSLYGS